MAAGGAASVAKDGIIEVLEKFRWAKETLPSVYYDSLALFDQLNECDSEITRELKGERTVLNFMSSEDQTEFEELLKKEPVVAVIGSVNSGKTSFINELLGGSFFPTREIPCTARCVRIKYDQRNVLKVLSPEGDVLEDVEFKKKTVPDKYINLEELEKRRDAKEVEKTVEVGLNHELLKSGLVLVDFPGDSENEVLNSMVRECMYSALQTVIYIVDGNNNLKLTELKMLLEIRKKAPNMKIIFVCNKTDHDAAKYDGSDPDSDEEEEVANLEENTKDKAKDVFNRLQKNKLLPDDLIYSDRLQHFHGISCTKFRKARLENRKDAFMENFEFLKKSIVQTFCESTKDEIERMSVRMEDKLSVLFKFTAQNITDAEIKENIKDLKKKNAKFSELIDIFEKESETDMKEYITKRICLDPKDLVEAISTGNSSILEEMNREIALAVMKLAITLTICELVKKCIIKLSKDHYVALKLLLRVSEMKMHVPVEKLDNEWLTALINMVNNHLTLSIAVIGIPLSNPNWRRLFAERIVALIDENLINKIVQAIKQKYTHVLMKAKQRVEGIKNLLCTIRNTSKEETKLLKQVRQGCCRNLYITKALQQTLQHGYVQLGPRRRDVENGDIVTYEGHPWGGKNNFVVRKVPGEKEPTEKFCQSKCEDESDVGFIGVAYDVEQDFVMLWDV